MDSTENRFVEFGYPVGREKQNSLEIGVLRLRWSFAALGGHISHQKYASLLSDGHLQTS